MLTSVMLLVAVAALIAGGCAIAEPPGFALHGSFTGIGSGLETIVGPGPDGATEWVYASHVYSDRFDIVAVEPITGETAVFTCPLEGESGAWALILGPDKQIYAGSLPRARVWRLDWGQRALVDMGRPSPTESYIWQFAIGTDGKLYGCTFPSAKLVRFDPATGAGEDLGRMSETEQYARSVAADDNGFVYVGIGMARQDLVAYEIATGRHASILPADLAKPGCVSVYRGQNGRAYANAGRLLRLNGFEPPVELPSAEVSPALPLQLADGRLVSYDGRTVSLRDPATGNAQTRETAYRGKSQDVFRLGLGPDGRLYGSTAMPIHFFWADPESAAWDELGVAGGGEFYSFLAWKDKLIGAAYSGTAPIMIYTPGQPWRPAATPEGNPWQVHYEGENAGWRPMAMIAGPGDLVYIGAVSGYGELGGPLAVLDPATGKVEQYMHVVKDQSVIALAALPDGLLVGGTTIGGGGGSHPTQSEAKLFLWDPESREKVFETTPVAGASSIDALGVGRDGLVYGFSGGTAFVFDPSRRCMISTATHRMGGVIYNSLVAGPDGALYGLSRRGVCVIDERAGAPRMVAEYPGGISAGVAIRKGRIYFASGPQIVSYALP